MKLGKDEIQKIVLGVLLLLGVVYSYFDLLLGPLKAGQEATEKSTTALGPEINGAKLQIKRTEDLEKKAPEATRMVRQVSQMIPDGSPVAWFPTRVADFFKRQGLDRAATRMNTEIVDKDLAGFRRIAWGIELPKVEFVQLGNALAAFENEEPLLEISSIQIDASREEVETQRVALTASNMVKQ